VKDYGAATQEPIDNPDVALTVAQAVARGEHERAILVRGTGIGMTITANKVPDVYAAVAHDAYSAAKARTSTTLRCLPRGARVIATELATTLTDIWLQAEFGGGASAWKVGKIEEAERSLGQDSEAVSVGGVPIRAFKKLINDPFEAVDEAIAGFVAAHSDIVSLAAPRVVTRRASASGKIGIVGWLRRQGRSVQQRRR